MLKVCDVDLLLSGPFPSCGGCKFELCRANQENSARLLSASSMRWTA